MQNAVKFVRSENICTATRQWAFTCFCKVCFVSSTGFYPQTPESAEVGQCLVHAREIIVAQQTGLS